MEAQEILDKVVEHLRKQGKPALDSRGDCMYRAPQENGKVLMCAIGCLIPDSLYSDSIENESVDTLLDNYNFPNIAEYIGMENTELCNRLQLIHDDSEPKFWEEEWRALAEDFSLVYPEPTNRLPAITFS